MIALVCLPSAECLCASLHSLWARELPGDEDTVTGFLLAGIGEIDAKKNGNFLVVNGSMCPAHSCDVVLLDVFLVPILFPDAWRIMRRETSAAAL